MAATGIYEDIVNVITPLKIAASDTQPLDEGMVPALPLYVDYLYEKESYLIEHGTGVMEVVGHSNPATVAEYNDAIKTYNNNRIDIIRANDKGQMDAISSKIEEIVRGIKYQPDL